MLVSTVDGEVDDSLLEKREYQDGSSLITEYYHEGRLVHRSSTIALKPLPPATGTLKPL